MASLQQVAIMSVFHELTAKEIFEVVRPGSGCNLGVAYTVGQEVPVGIGGGGGGGGGVVSGGI